MKIRNAGWAHGIGLASFTFALALLACGVSVAAEVERRAPVTRGGTGWNITLENHGEGERGAALPCLSASRETLEQLMDRIHGKTGAMKTPGDGAIPSTLDARPAESDASPCSIGTLRRRAAGAKFSGWSESVPYKGC